MVRPLLSELIDERLLPEDPLCLRHGVDCAEVIAAVVESDADGLDEPTGGVVEPGDAQDPEDLPGNSFGYGGGWALCLASAHADQAVFGRPLAEQPAGFRGTTVVFTRLYSDLLGLALCDPGVDEDHVDRAAAEPVKHVENVRSDRGLGQTALVEAAAVHCG
jgi:hypothetical protein